MTGDWSMEQFEYTIKDKIGLHARPAGILVKEASRFKCSISVSNMESGNSADAKKLFALMNLMIKHGCKISVTCNGDDEVMAVSAMKKCIEENL